MKYTKPVVVSSTTARNIIQGQQTGEKSADFFPDGGMGSAHPAAYEADE
jgi:hypothetical protein